MKKRMRMLLIGFMVGSASMAKGMDTTEEYDTIDSFDDRLDYVTAQKWGLEKYYHEHYGSGNSNHPSDPAKQLKIAKHYLYQQGDIEKIKKFHAQSQCSYKDPYRVSIGSYNPDTGRFPIDWALCKNHIDFALWLIKEQNVDVSYISPCKHSKFHYLARGMIHKKCTPQYADLMRLLIENKALINIMDTSGRTPLWFYTDCTDTKDIYNSEISRLFFDHGARLVVQQVDKDDLKVCNLIHEVLKLHKAYKPAQLIKGRLDAVCPFVGANYRNQLHYVKKKYDTCFIALSLWNKQLKTFKIPKPIMHMICKMATAYDENIEDIKAALSNKMEIKNIYYKTIPINVRKKIFTEEEVILRVTPLGYARQSDFLSVNSMLLKILTPTFWNSPLGECYAMLDILLG